jgi:hypothetical protein
MFNPRTCQIEQFRSFLAAYNIGVVIGDKHRPQYLLAQCIGIVFSSA